MTELTPTILPRMPGLTRTPGLAWPAALLLAACGAGPRPTAFDARPEVAVELAQLGAGRAGELELDRVDAQPASRIRLARPFRSADQGDGWRTYTFDPPSPVARVRQILPTGDPSRPLGAVVMLRAGDAMTSARRLDELVAAGLGPTTTAGFGKLRGSDDEPAALIARTPDPSMLLAFQGDHVVAVLRELAPGAVTAQLPWFTSVEEFTATIESASTDRLRAALTALQQDVPVADRAALGAAPRARLQALDVAHWTDLADEAATWDARFATADLTTRLTMMIEQALLLRRAGTDDVPLGGRALAWREAGWNGLRADLEAALRPGLDRDEVASRQLLAQLDTFRAQHPARLAGDDGRAAWQTFAGHIAWERARLAMVDPAAPFNTTRDELDHLLRSLDAPDSAAFRPDSTLLATCVTQAARRLRGFAGDATQSEIDRAWATALAEDLDAARSDRLREVRNDAATTCGLLTHLATRIAGADHEVAAWAGLAQGLREMLRDDRPPAVRTQAAAALGRIAARARALANATQEPADRAAFRAFTAGLQLPDLALTTLAESATLLAAARAVDLRATRPVTDRVADLEALANQQQRFGPLAAMVSAELAVPLGRELAERAAGLSETGSHALAAELLLSAASIGSAEGPAPKDSIELRREAKTLRTEAARDDAPTPLLRTYWLHLAQVEALLAIASLLPPLADDDPLRALQSRFVARQLGGRAGWSLRYGLRLADQADVQRASGQSPPVRLGLVDGAPRWVSPEHPAPRPGPEGLHADPQDWAQLADLSEAVVAARDALRAVEGSRDLSRPEIENRDQQLLERIHELEQAIERGQVEPLAARARIDRLQREARALRDLLEHFNDRTRHVLARSHDYNDRVKVYNARLEAALADLGTCFGEVLGPATEAWIKERLAAPELEDAERQTRAALCGTGPLPDAVAPRPAHPLSVAAAVRDATTPTRAAALLAAELERRLGDVTYNAGVPAEEHIARLRPAFEVFVQDYGAAAFARALLRGALGERRPLHDAVVATLGDETLRDAVEQAR